ncbi:hypothetical protein QUF55_00610 [Clostridiaceae bacterium HSG29]|nr:hypothetical protein [Clostridiaceae bacterium HSG29]
MKKIISVIIIISIIMQLSGCSAPKISKEEDIINQIYGGFLYTSNLKAESKNENKFNEERKKAIEIFMKMIENTAKSAFKVTNEIEEYEENLMKYMDEIEDENEYIQIQEIANKMLAYKIAINSYEEQINTYLSLKSENEVTDTIIDNYVFTDLISLVETQNQYILWLKDNKIIISDLISSERKSDKLISSSEKIYEDIDEKYNEMIFEYQKLANIYSYITSADYYVNLYHMIEIKKNIDTLKEDQSDDVKELEDLYNKIIATNSKPSILRDIPKNEKSFQLIKKVYAFENDAISGFAFLDLFTEISVIEDAKYSEDNKKQVKSKESTAMEEEIKKRNARNQEIIKKISDGQSAMGWLSAAPDLQFAGILGIMSSALLSKKDKLNPTQYEAISNLITKDLEQVLGDKKGDFLNIIINTNANQLLEVFNKWKDKTDNLKNLNFNKQELIGFLNMLGLNIEQVKVETQPVAPTTTPAVDVAAPSQNMKYDITQIKATRSEINNIDPSMGNDEILGALFGWKDDVSYSGYKKVEDSGVWDHYVDSENNKIGWAERSNNSGYAYIYYFPNDLPYHIEIKRGLEGEKSDIYSIDVRDDDINKVISIKLKRDDKSDVYYKVLVDIIQKVDREYDGLNIKTNSNSQYVRNYSSGNLIDLVAYKKEIIVKEESHEYIENDVVSNISEYTDNGDMLETYEEKNGKLNGLYTMYYEKEKIKSKIDYANGMKNGNSYIYYENGKNKEIIVYKDNERNGEYQSFYETGKLAKKEEYEMGIKNGMFYDYNSNESLAKEAEYKQGELNGIYREYAVSANGSRWETTYVYGQYEDGKQVGYWEWGNYGDVWTAKREYSNGIMTYFQNRKEIIHYNDDGTIKK